MDMTALLVGGFVLNAVVTIGAVMRSKLLLEHRLTKVETFVSILVRNSGAHLRSSDKDMIKDILPME